MVRNLSQYIDLLVLAVVLVILAKLVVILKLGLRNISKKIKNSYIFKHPHSNGTCFDSSNSHCFKIIDEANSKLDLKAKEALHINWKKPNLNVQENHFALTLSLYLLPNLPGPDFFFCICFLCFAFFYIPFIYYVQYLYGNYWNLLLSYLHFAITSYHYNTPSNRFYNNNVINICPRQLL